MRVYVCIHIYAYMCLYVCMYVYVYIFVHVYTHKDVYIICVYTNTSVYFIRVCIHYMCSINCGVKGEAWLYKRVRPN